MGPTTATQLGILITFVVPGIVYQAVRARLAGEAPQNRDTTNKVLRALAASAVLFSVYLIVIGPTLVRVASGNGEHTGEWVADHARLTGLSALVLLFLLPACVAVVAAKRWYIGEKIASWRGRGSLASDARLGRSRTGGRVNRFLGWLGARSQSRSGLRYEPTPTAWDWAVDHGAPGRGFVRVLAKDGQWKGGAYAHGSYFTTYPEPPAVYVEQAWQMDELGRFIAVQEATRGAWIPCVEALTVEFVGPVQPSNQHQAKSYTQPGGDDGAID